MQMIQKPKQFSSEYAEPFRDLSVVKAYHHRPPYPAETFDILKRLTNGQPQRVLDIGCGTGNLARHFIEYVEQIDAVDFSRQMLQEGQRLPGGDHPRLRWIWGRVEEVVLNGPYGLVMAGESLHWMDWNLVLPRLHEVLMAGGYLAIVEQRTIPDPWSTLSEIIRRYRTDGGYQPYNMIEELERHGLFQKVGEQETAPISFVQSIDDYIASYHSRSGFSKERMGQAQADTFDQEARSILLNSHSDGTISLQVVGSVVWGFPLSILNSP